MRFFLFLLFILTILLPCAPQQELLYNPETDALEQVQYAVEKAGAENKHVLIQIGGNWCPWCIRLHQFIKEHKTLDSLIQADYIPIYLNYSKENKNSDIMAMLHFPQRFGFPVLVLLDASGNRLHTQNTAYLEEGQSYSEEKIEEFLKAWNRLAVDPASYSSTQ